jgi:murein DD-endopeptidase MepM/ murein hydrolase activator NlpD
VPWKPAGLVALLCSGVAVAALPGRGADRAPEDHQWQALAVGPLASGGTTGLRMMPTAAAEPIDVAPERAQVRLTLTLGAHDSVRALLMRAGAHFGDAVRAGELIEDAVAVLRAGTKVAVTLGRKQGVTRALDGASLSGGLGLSLHLVRDGGSELRLVQQQAPVDRTPLRIQGRVADGLYWSLRAAGVSPHSAAEYLQALATEIDVGSDVGPHDRFDLVIASRRAPGSERETGPLLYAGIDRAAAEDLQLVRWGLGGRLSWVNAGHVERPSAASMMWPVAGRITSGFGYRIHPILRFARLHKGVDFGASWGTPIVAAADGQVTAAGWAGGYGRQVRIAHADGIATSYSHMSRIVADEGRLVRRGEVIGYVGSSGLSTGPHLHYEVRKHGTPVNPMNVRFAGAAIDTRQADAIKARLKALLSVGAKKG